MAEPGLISYAQEDLWYVSRLVPKAVPYNEVAVLRRSGPLDVDALRRAYAEIVRRHDVWRTTFPLLDGHPVQFVATEYTAEFPVVDMRGSGSPDPERVAATVAAELAGQPYDLEHGPVLRPLVVQVGDEDFRIYLAAHHLVFDCLSLARVAVPELLECYEAARAGRSPELAPVRKQYADYTTWERGWVEGTSGRRRLDHWQRHLADAVPPVLPFDRPRVGQPRFRGGAEPIFLPAALTERLRSAGQAAGGSLFQAVAAGFATLLHRYSGQPNVVFGTAVDLRRRPELEQVLGFAATWLAIRADLSGDPPFEAVIRQLRDEVLEAVDMAIPFGQVIAALHPRRGDGANPLLRALFVVNPTADLPPGWDLDLVEPLVADAIGATKLDLQVELQEHPAGGIRGRVIFDADLFDRRTIRSLVTDWLALLDAVMVDPQRPMSGLRASGSDVLSETAVGRPRTELERSLVAIWARVLEIDHLGVHDDFFDLGGRSLLAVQMLLEVERELGIEVPVTALLYGGATVAGLARVIETGSPVADGGSHLPVVFIWPHEPAVLALRHLRSGFGPETQVTSLVVPDPREDPASVEELAEAVLAQIKAQQPTGPYALAGFSLGGLVAYEIAARLRAADEVVAWLCILDVPTPEAAKRSHRPAARLARLLDKPPAERRRRLAAAAHAGPAGDVTEAKVAAESRAFELRWWKSAGRYAPAGHDTPMDLIVAHDTAWRYRDPSLGWAALHPGPLAVHVVAGNHDSMLMPPQVTALGQRFSDILRAVTDPGDRRAGF